MILKSLERNLIFHKNHLIFPQKPKLAKTFHSVYIDTYKHIHSWSALLMILFFIKFNNYAIALIFCKQTKQPWLYSIIKNAIDNQTHKWSIRKKVMRSDHNTFPSLQNIPNTKLLKLVDEVQTKYFIISPFGMIVLSFLSRALPS